MVRISSLCSEFQPGVSGHWEGNQCSLWASRHCLSKLTWLILGRYHCHTCKMVDGVGVCTVCAKVCHKDHEISYAKYGSFFCDCGAKEDGSCLVNSLCLQIFKSFAIFCSAVSYVRIWVRRSAKTWRLWLFNEPSEFTARLEINFFAPNKSIGKSVP